MYHKPYQITAIYKIYIINSFINTSYIINKKIYNCLLVIDEKEVIISNIRFSCSSYLLT